MDSVVYINPFPNMHIGNLIQTMNFRQSDNLFFHAVSND